MLSKANWGGILTHIYNVYTVEAWTSGDHPGKIGDVELTGWWKHWHEYVAAANGRLHVGNY